MRYMLANLLLALLPPTRFFALKAKLLRLLGVGVHPSSRICGDVRFYGAGAVTIGAGCWIGLGAKFYTSLDGHVTIGKNCDIAPEVTFMCGTHDIGPPARRAGVGRAESIVVGDGTWIGVRSTILGGAAIGRSSIVAAGSLLLPKLYPDSVLLVGAPAATKRTL